MTREDQQNESRPYPMPRIGEVAEATDTDDMPEGLSEIPGSLCMNCGAEGTTRMLMTKIPFFREIILSSFECDSCGWKNNEVLFGGELQEKGCRFELDVLRAEDNNRQIIRSDYATVIFPEIEFEIPPRERGGEITTIEGLLSTAAERLTEDQPARAAEDPALALKVGEVIMKLTSMARGEEGFLPFTLVVDDPSGNSFVENPHAPNKDTALKTIHYTRTEAQDLKIGLQPQPSTDTGATAEGGTAGGAAASAAGGAPGDVNETTTSLRGEVLELPETCPQCGALGDTRVCVTDIPHFKEVVIMAFDCPKCAYKSNEVKGGGAVPLLGTQHTLKVLRHEDLGRDVLKSDTASLVVPEAELELGMGTLGGIYTTVEGLLDKIKDNLTEGNPFVHGDSAYNHHGSSGTTAGRFFEFLQRLGRLRRGEELPFTLELRDPLGNSFIGCLGDDMDPISDPQLAVVDYERSHQENEDLGLNDINTAPFETLGNEGANRAEHQRPKQHRVGTDHPGVFTKGTEVADVTQASALPPAGAIKSSGSASAERSTAAAAPAAAASPS